jgi:hypothetical protein
MAQREPTEMEVRVRMMKVLIGVDPHKTSVAVAVVHEVIGELVECATLLQNRAGLRGRISWLHDAAWVNLITTCCQK